MPTTAPTPALNPFAAAFADYPAKRARAAHLQHEILGVMNAYLPSPRPHPFPLVPRGRSRWARLRLTLEHVAELAALSAGEEQSLFVQKAVTEMAARLKAGEPAAREFRHLLQTLFESCSHVLGCLFGPFAHHLDNGSALRLDVDPRDEAEVRALITAARALADAIDAGNGEAAGNAARLICARIVDED